MVPAAPSIVRTIPPTSMITERSVGVPVIILEISELREFKASLPNIISNIPPTRSANEIAFVMFFTSFKPTRNSEAMLRTLC